MPHYYAGEPVQEGYTPRGTVREVFYHCSVPGPSSRRMIVYLPEGYSPADTTRYPVLYLLHGARGYETSWIKKGRVLEISDSLFSNGLARKCIVVMPNMNQYNNQKDFENSRRKNAFEAIFEIDGAVESSFFNDVVHTTDSLFSTLPFKHSRAVAGLSIGATQSAAISAMANTAFGYVGVLSPYLLLFGKPGPYHREAYGKLARNMSIQFRADESIIYRLYVGDKDFLRHSINNFHKKLQRLGCRHEYIVIPGGHRWATWRDAYTDLITHLFKD